ncbi:MAG: hypothetical protein GY810_09715 [Aureispira sp.]|nr:hypothetical protein [Aureispira sp.]
MANQPTPKQLQALARLQILAKKYVQVAKKAGLIKSKESPIFKKAQKYYIISKQTEKALVLHNDAAKKLQKNKQADGFWDTNEVDSKVDAAVETISSADLTKLEYEIKAYADAYKTVKARKGNLKVEGTAQTHNEASFKMTAELESVLEGVNVLIDAGVISESSLEVNAEYKTKYLSLEAQLQVLAVAKANVSADIKLFDLSTLTLVKAELEATAEVEVNVNVHAEGELQIVGDDLTANVEADGKAYAKAEATAEANLVISKDEVKGEYRLAALAEAGVEGTIEGSIQSEGEELVSISATGKAVTGVGVESAGGFEWKDGEVTVKVDLGLAVEAGAGGEVELTVDYDAIGDAVVKQIKDGSQHLIENGDEIYDKIKAELKEQGQTLHNTYEDATNALNNKLNDLKKKYFSR